MQVLIIVIVFSLIYFLSLQGGVQMEPVVAAIIGLTAVVVANIISERSGWKKVRQKIGSLDDTSLSSQHDDIKSILKDDIKVFLKEDIKTQVENVQSIVTKEQHIREEREKNLSPQGKDFATAVEKLADYTNLLTDLTKKYDLLQRDYDNLRNENEFLKQEINDLKNATPSIDTGWQYDNSQGRGRSR